MAAAINAVAQLSAQLSTPVQQTSSSAVPEVRCDKQMIQATCYSEDSLMCLYYNNKEKTFRCGDQCYPKSQQVCYGTRLCQVINGIAQQICGNQCYNSAEYACIGTTLCRDNGEEGGQLCGSTCYYASEYYCYPDNTLCAVINGTVQLKCNQTCYLPSQYSCANGTLISLAGVQPKS